MPDSAARIDQAWQAGALSRRRSLAAGIWSILLIADLALITRRLSGEIASAVPGSLAVLSTVLVAAGSGAAWCFCSTSLSPCLTRQQRWIPHAIAVAVTLLWAWPISIGATALTCGIVLAVAALQLAAIVAAELDVRFQSPRSTAAPSRPPPAGSRLTDGSSAPAPDLVVAEIPDAVQPVLAPLIDESLDIDELDESLDEADESQTLWLSRRQNDDEEWIEGWVRVRFAQGQRETIVHVSFCPVLAGIAEIDTEDLDGAGLEIRVAAAFPFGARLAVRRSGPLDERHGDRIGFSARSVPGNRAA